MSEKLSLFFLLLCFTFQIQSQNLSLKTTIKDHGENLNIEETLSKYIQFESISGNEIEAGKWFKSLCEQNGLYVQQMGDTNGNYNFTASIYPLDHNLPNIILLNHIDVVPAGDITKWEHNAFSGDITDTEIWGRGAFDNKGNGIMHLFSVIEILKKYGHTKMPYNVTLLAVSCEEKECNGGGAEYVIQNYLNTLNPIVVLGEGPPGFNGILDSKPNQNLFGISITNKRPLWLELSLEVKTSAHGSITPINYANKGMIKALDNLIEKRQKVVYNDINLNILKQLGQWETGIKSVALKHPRLFKIFIAPKLRHKPELLSLFSNSITLTSVDSHNSVINVIPDEVTALLDCRLLPHQTNEEFVAEVKKQLKNKRIKIKIIKESPIVPASNYESQFYINIKNAIEKNYPNAKTLSVSVPNYNDASFFRAQGINSFCFTPMQFDRHYLEYIHNVNERIPRGVLIPGTQTFIDVIESCFIQ
ncbi:M20/M25/M40 family metallo-hydrolase [Formosa sediminum]|uniref:M20/M25/M40 family metallo-hydrolase n=1 Tax=Formosa sediminum TaxID=2594004 RepID=A0A516GN44_9FLAO|nr:M20/M25/M40 family metallo-hydrolase [Formosa sediminum]QDO92790.1 M20/M25/M40 family metallo-hydrolase [Formosa sediminum]